MMGMGRSCTARVGVHVNLAREWGITLSCPGISRILRLWVSRDPKSLRSHCLAGTILGGPWDIGTTYNWAYTPTYDPPK